jgi:hypothetical protein
MKYIEEIILFFRGLGTPIILFLCVFMNLFSLIILRKIEKNKHKIILIILFLPYFLLSVSLGIYIVYYGLNYNSLPSN